MVALTTVTMQLGVTQLSICYFINILQHQIHQCVQRMSIVDVYESYCIIMYDYIICNPLDNYTDIATYLILVL